MRRMQVCRTIIGELIHGTCKVSRCVLLLELSEAIAPVARKILTLKI